MERTDATMWTNHGGGILNQRRGGADGRITASRVGELRLRWRFPTGFDVSATPSTEGRSVYFPGWDGNLYALDSRSGQLLWRLNLTALAATATATLSRSTPVVYKHLLLVGLYGPPLVLAINRHCGSLVWKSQPLDDAANAAITMSGTAFQGFYYVGTSSLQEFTPSCCSFQGSFQKLRLRDGRMMWKTYMVPRGSQYYGVSIWGSSPSIYEKQRLIYIGTGNNYQVPANVEECEEKRSNSSSSSSREIPDTCLDPEDHEDSMVAVHMDNGSIAWSKRLQAYDVWTLSCSQSAAHSPNCPGVMGPDYDFGEAPMVLHLQHHHHPANDSSSDTCLVVAGQKSGVVWALDCDTGDVVWSTVAGPGGSFGGASWGSCTDGERIYSNIVNNQKQNFTLAPNKNVTNGGGWVAMEARTGRVVWTTPDPRSARAFGPMSVANGVVFAGSFSDTGEVHAFNSSTGAILWSFSTGSNIHGGFSISQNCIFGGNGYKTNIPLGKVGNYVFAFCLPDEHDTL